MHTQQRQLQIVLFDRAIAGPVGSIGILVAAERHERCIWVGLIADSLLSEGLDGSLHEQNLAVATLRFPAVA